MINFSHAINYTANQKAKMLHIMRYCLQNKSGAYIIVSWRKNGTVCIIDKKIKMKESLAHKKVINSPQKWYIALFLSHCHRRGL